MSVNTARTARSSSEKKVSFRSRTDTPNTTDSTEDSPRVEITSFPHAEIKSILRLNLHSPKNYISQQSRRKKKQEIKVPEVTVRTPKRRTQSFKEPTETVKHALLRSMSHREPNEATRAFFAKALCFRPSGRELDTNQNKMILTPRSIRGPTGVLSSNVDPFKVRITCGQCTRRQRIEPAAGFCKYCTEYLCARCVTHHRSGLTRRHPVIVFYCQTCKEMNILNGRGSGHCVRCKCFFCSVCIIKHCTDTEHRILEGEDLQDVVDFMIQR